MSNIFDRISGKTSKDVKLFVKKSFDIADQIHEILEKKGLTQKEFSEKLGKTEAEISKWLSGSHNFTIKSIAKIEAILGEEIILTPFSHEKKLAKMRNVACIQGSSSRIKLLNKTKSVRLKKSEIFNVLTTSYHSKGKKTKPYLIM